MKLSICLSSTHLPSCHCLPSSICIINSGWISLLQLVSACAWVGSGWTKEVMRRQEKTWRGLNEGVVCMHAECSGYVLTSCGHIKELWLQICKHSRTQRQSSKKTRANLFHILKHGIGGIVLFLCLRVDQPVWKQPWHAYMPRFCHFYNIINNNQH